LLANYVSAVSKITAILEADPDGTLHIPLPPDLRQGKIRVEAKLERAGTGNPRPQYGCLSGKIWLAPDFDAPLDDFKEYME
jgi:hypothetical protein